MMGSLDGPVFRCEKCRDEVNMFNPNPHECRRQGDWIQTFTGRQFWPLDPRPEDVDILDIAHALANKCRYTGHTSRFYSVAEHSIYVSFVVPEEHRKWALLHDAAEAYLADVARPIKQYLPGWKELEAKVMLAICQRFNLVPIEPAEVKRADTAILHDEKRDLFAQHPAREWDLTEAPLGLTILGLLPAAAEKWFLERWERVK